MGSGRTKSPVVAVLLSGLMPGLGQLYCREWAKGLGCLAAITLVDYAAGVSQGMLDVLLKGALPQDTTRFLAGALLVLGIAGWSVFDAARTASRSSV